MGSPGSVAGLTASIVMGLLWIALGRDDLLTARVRTEEERPLAVFLATAQHDFLQAGGFLVIGAAAATLHGGAPASMAPEAMKRKRAEPSNTSVEALQQHRHIGRWPKPISFSLRSRMPRTTARASPLRLTSSRSSAAPGRRPPCNRPLMAPTAPDSAAATSAPVEAITRAVKVEALIPCSAGPNTQ